MVSRKRNFSRKTSKPGVLSRLYEWLAVSDQCQKSDVIFVLAGRECRKHFALRLFRQGWAPTLLLSVGRFEIRRFSNLELPASLDLPAVASTTEPRRRHYFVTIGSGTAEAQRIAVSRFGTMREILAFSNWLREHVSVRSAMVVSSGFHLKRVRMCCRRLVPDETRLQFVAAPEESGYLPEDWWRNARARKLVFSEVAKVAIYKLLCQRLIARARSWLHFPQGRTRTDGFSVEESR
jgi:hypothetical protein